jgi:hypothetical protein
MARRLLARRLHHMLVRNIDHISKSCRHVIEDANNKGIHDASAPPNEPVASAAAPARH